MKVLSIYWGICASASIFIDGKVVAATHEERYTRIKNDDSFPENAINYCLSEAGISASELDLAVIASNIQEFNYQVTRHAKWSVEDYLKEQINYWKPMLYDKKN